MAVSTMVQHLKFKRDLNIVTYVSHVLSQARNIQPLLLHNYIFIHEVNLVNIDKSKLNF